MQGCSNLPSHHLKGFYCKVFVISTRMVSNANRSHGQVDVVSP